MAASMSSSPCLKALWTPRISRIGAGKRLFHQVNLVVSDDTISGEGDIPAGHLIRLTSWTREPDIENLDPLGEELRVE
jgi:hypothetical protein